MNKKIILYILILSVFYNGFSQNEFANWYFGYRGGLDFNSGSPLGISGGNVNSDEACATISDSDGNLLFYTDGITVWDKNHNVMPNGSDLFGDRSSTQVVIVPKPLNTNIYYIFTVDKEAMPLGLRYSEVNLALNNGNGDITLNKNVLLAIPVSEKLSVIQHVNEVDFWVVSHSWGNSNFLAYKINSSGINTIPIVSSIGVTHDGDRGNSIGYMKISSNGQRIALAMFEENIVELFDFDISTGVVSNSISIPFDEVFISSSNDGVYGLEFSPNSNLLYVSYRNDIVLKSIVYQLDIRFDNSVDIINSNEVLYFGSDDIGAIQLAIDGKIYLANFFLQFIDVIHNPNEIGTSANYTNRGVPIYGKSAMGLPYVLPFFEIKIQVANTCFIDETEFSLNTNASNITVLWDFGDGATSSENNSTHIYSLAGNYVVTAQVTVDGVVKIITKEITITTAPVANVIEDVFICDDVLNDGIEIFNLNDLNQDILGIQTGLIITYHLTQNDATLNRDSLNTMFENTTNPQQLFVRVESEINPKCFDTTSFDISITETPELELQDVFYICKNESVEIIVEGDFDSYIWSTGENTSSIIVNEAGIYNVTVSNNNLPQSTTTCSATKSFTVLQSDIPSSINFEVVDFSQNNRITVIVEGEGNYEYSINGFNYQDNSTFENLTESEYTVYVRDKRGCGIVSEEVFLLSQPKFFTPNGDGINDYWQIKSSFTEPEIDIQIFDRYGKLLLSFTGNSIGWDGNFNGQKLPTNDYWFVIKRPSNDKTYRGHFTLKR